MNRAIESRMWAIAIGIGCFVQFISGSAYGQWKEQEITLRPGWNAVFLEVDPAPNDCAAVFDGIPVESVWAWNRRFSTVQFVRDANTLTPQQPEWLVYFGAGNTRGGASTLFAIHGRPLLIKLSGSESVVWSVRGRPSLQAPRWNSDAFNLVGFHLDHETPPKFSTFLGQDEALAGQPVHRLGEDGRWTEVANPASSTMQPGEAYWVYCDGPSTFAGGLHVRTETGDGLRFGRGLVEQTLTLRNTTRSVQSITLDLGPSLAAPQSESRVAGDINLSYWEFSDVGRWLPLEGSYTVNVPGGAESRIRLEANRPAAGGMYQSLLTVRSGSGLSMDIPVSAAGIGGDGNKQGETHPRAGLWIGTVAVDKVNFVTSDVASERATPVPTASEFQLRILIHVDAGGTPRLLQEVIQMWRPGTLGEDGTVAVPGEFVLLTDDSRIGEFEGATLRDGTPAGRRFSTAAFGFREPIEMAGAFSTPLEPDATVECEVVLPYDDPLNPFLHRYHPDHDNLNFDFEPYTGNPEQESYTVTRRLTLDFQEEDPEGLAIAGWGDTQIGGAYRETIQGIYKETETIQVEGVFRLQHASRVPELNPEF